ncbi:unnamed protein product [Moneuplotes crassus]|uniref:Uncharacterized protein n=1 Tax=Euplotes crassus TaxID=5936 RepID=A0AAD1XT21_EUPCR|nr:unnamed protein product [Moneuplotes crassus]
MLMLESSEGPIAIIRLCRLSCCLLPISQSRIIKDSNLYSLALISSKCKSCFLNFFGRSQPTICIFQWKAMISLITLHKILPSFLKLQQVIITVLIVSMHSNTLNSFRDPSLIILIDFESNKSREWSCTKIFHPLINFISKFSCSAIPLSVSESSPSFMFSTNPDDSSWLFLFNTENHVRISSRGLATLGLLIFISLHPRGCFMLLLKSIKLILAISF